MSFLWKWKKVERQIEQCQIFSEHISCGKTGGLVKMVNDWLLANPQTRVVSRQTSVIKEGSLQDTTLMVITLFYRQKL